MKKKLMLSVVFLFSLHPLLKAEPMQKVANELGRRIVKMKNPRVGLLNFPYHDGKVSSGSSILSERLTTSLASVKGLRLVERHLMRKLLEEQHLSETGIVDASSAQQIGKILGVDVIVTGTLIDVDNNHTELNARAIKADTGEVLAASQVTVDRVWPDQPRNPQPLVKYEPPEEPAPQKVENEAIMVGYPSGRGGMRGGGGRR